MLAFDLEAIFSWQSSWQAKDCFQGFRASEFAVGLVSGEKKKVFNEVARK